LGQAYRISGINPADLSVLMVYLNKKGWFKGFLADFCRVQSQANFGTTLVLPALPKLEALFLFEGKGL
jgi:hypothetical protein